MKLNRKELEKLMAELEGRGKMTDFNKKLRKHLKRGNKKIARRKE